MATPKASTVKNLIPYLGNPSEHEAFWLHEKRKSARKAVIEFYVWWNGLTDEQKAREREKQAHANAKPDDIADKIEKSFRVFAKGRPTYVDGIRVTPLKKLAKNQGDNKKLADFLAAERIYKIADPLKLLTDEMNRENTGGIKVAAFFIASISEASKQSESTRDALFRKALASYSKSSAEGDFVPRDRMALNRQKELAVILVPFLLEKGISKNRRLLVLACTIAGISDLKKSVGRRTYIKNQLIKLAHKIAVTFGFNPPNVRPLIDDLEKEIQGTIDARNQALDKRKLLIKASSVRGSTAIDEAPDTVTVSPEKALLSPVDFYDQDALANAKYMRLELREQLALEKEVGEPFKQIAQKALALAKTQPFIKLAILEPYIEKKRKWVATLEANNRKMEKQDPFRRDFFYKTPTDEIDIEVEALIAARMEAKKLEAEGKTVPEDLRELLSNIEGLLGLIATRMEAKKLEAGGKTVPEDLRERSRSIEPLFIKLEEVMQADQPVAADASQSPATDLKKSTARNEEERKIEKAVAILLKKLKSKSLTYVADKRFELVRVSDTELYCIDTERSLGSGGFASVILAAYKCDPETGEPNFQDPFTVKKIAAGNAHENIENEVQAAQKTRRASYVKIENYQPNWKINEDHYFIFSAFEPGVHLGMRSDKDDARLPDMLEELNLLDRLSTIVDAFSQLAVLHGKGFVHGDINDKNILINASYNNSKRQVSATLIDTGAARMMPTKEIPCTDEEKKVLIKDAATKKQETLSDEEIERRVKASTATKEVPYNGLVWAGRLPELKIVDARPNNPEPGFYLYRDNDAIHALIVHDKETQETLNLTELAKTSKSPEQQITGALNSIPWPGKGAQKRLRAKDSKLIKSLVQEKSAYYSSAPLVFHRNHSPAEAYADIPENAKFFGRVGFKSDIAATVPILIGLLGGGKSMLDSRIAAMNELASKQKSNSSGTDQEKKIRNRKIAAEVVKQGVGFDTVDVLTNFGLPKALVDIVKDFINRAQDSDYDRRPDAETCTKFFICLRNFISYCTFEAKGDYDTTTDDKEMQGLWDELLALSKMQTYIPPAAEQQNTSPAASTPTRARGMTIFPLSPSFSPIRPHQGSPSSGGNDSPTPPPPTSSSNGGVDVSTFFQRSEASSAFFQRLLLSLSTVSDTSPNTSRSNPDSNSGNNVTIFSGPDLTIYEPLVNTRAQADDTPSSPKSRIVSSNSGNNVTIFSGPDLTVYKPPVEDQSDDTPSLPESRIV